jgi:hypothetical protein
VHAKHYFSLGFITHIAHVNHYLPCLVFATRHSLALYSFLSLFITSTSQEAVIASESEAKERHVKRIVARKTHRDTADVYDGVSTRETVGGASALVTFICVRCLLLLEIVRVLV